MLYILYLLNFNLLITAFDIQGALLNRNNQHQTQIGTRRNISSATVTTNRIGHNEKRSGKSHKSLVKVERTEPIQTRFRGQVSYVQEDDDDISPAFMDEDDDNDETDTVHCFRGVMEDGIEINVHPKDLIITPDICTGELLHCYPSVLLY